MDNQELKKECSLGLAEDVNGEFYTIYDADKLIKLAEERLAANLLKHLTDGNCSRTALENYIFNNL